MRLVIFLIISVFSGVTVLAQGKAVIRISAESTVESELITLGNIAKVSSTETGKLERLQLIPLGYAPNIGMTKEISRERIGLAISAAGFTENQFTLVAPSSILIRRSSQIADQSAIREAVEKMVLSNFQTEGVTARITKLDIPEKIEIPKGSVEIRAVNPTGTSNFFAPFIVSVEIRVNDKVIRRISANIETEVFAEVLVSIKNLTANEKITDLDVRKEKTRLEKSPSNYLIDADKLRGEKLLKNLSAGVPVTTDAIIAEAVIKAGDTVKIVGQSGKMQIIVSGEARTNGRIGDRIAVKNSQSGAILQAVVIDEGLVKIYF